MPTIYDYTDYHEWLAAAFNQKKMVHPSFSHRLIATKLGLKSSGYILYVMQGKRKLTETMALGLAAIYTLTKPQTDYLLELIRYSHARSSQEKQLHFEKLVALRRKQVKPVEPEQYRFYEKWYYPVLREAIALRPFTDDYTALATMITPSITPAEAKSAVELLIGIGLLVRDGNGTCHKKDAVISTGEVWHSATIHAHKRTLLGLSSQALDSIPKSDRDISHLTITASPETMELISQRIAHLRAELLEIARNEKAPDRVLLCNFAVFPVALRTEEKT